MNNQNAKADKGKPKLSLVPTEIINCIARCREYGTMKYHDPDNWKDVEKERYIDAAYRHWIKYVADNNSVDEESGLPHLWHCACNLAFLCEFDKVERETNELHEKAMKFAKDNQIPELTDKSNKDTICYNLGDPEPFVGTYSDEANGTINGYDFNCAFYYEGGTGKCLNLCSVNGEKYEKMQCNECPLWNGGQCEVKKELELCRKYDTDNNYNNEEE